MVTYLEHTKLNIWNRSSKFVKNKIGAMTVFFKHSLGARGHAVVWDGSKIYDSGLFQIYDFDKLPEKYARPYIRQFLQLVKISN